MAEGYLITVLTNGSEAYPIIGAKVKIKDNNGRVLYNLITDESGKTEMVTLPTVDRQLSLDPTYTGHPYTDYIVETEANGYRDMIIRGVHIFDGETAIQPAALIPELADRPDSQKIEINIGPNAIESSEKRNQIGITPDSSHPKIMPVILPVVAIPKFITVHLGRPTSTAQNVHVPFIDYIKNVASHEIYATWPENALRANIHVIVTFALNRIYTEWYRNRGFAFDMTKHRINPTEAENADKIRGFTLCIFLFRITNAQNHIF